MTANARVRRSAQYKQAQQEAVSAFLQQDNVAIKAEATVIDGKANSALGEGTNKLGERIDLNGVYPAFRHQFKAQEFAETNSEVLSFPDPRNGTVINFHLPVGISKVLHGHHDSTKVPLLETTAADELLALANDGKLSSNYQDMRFDNQVELHGASANTRVASKNLAALADSFPQEMWGLYEVSVERGPFVEAGVAGMQVNLTATAMWISKFSHPTERTADKLVSCVKLSPGDAHTLGASDEILIAVEAPRDPEPLFKKSMTALTGASGKAFVEGKLVARGHSDASAILKYEAFKSAVDGTDHVALPSLDSNDLGDYHKGVLSSSQTVHCLVFDHDNDKLMLLSQRNVIDDAEHRYPVFEMANLVLEGSGVYIDMDPSFSSVTRTVRDKFATIVRDTPIKSMTKQALPALSSVNGTEIEDELARRVDLCEEYEAVSEAVKRARLHTSAKHFLTAMSTAASADAEQSAFLTALASDHEAMYATFDAVNPMPSAPYDWTANAAMVFAEGRPYSSLSIASGVEMSDFEKLRNARTVFNALEYVISGLDLSGIDVSSANLYTVRPFTGVTVKRLSTDLAEFGATQDGSSFIVDLNGGINAVSHKLNSDTNVWERTTPEGFVAFHTTVVDGKVAVVSVATKEQPGLPRFEGTKEVGNNKCDEIRIDIFDNDGHGSIAYKLFFNIAFTTLDGVDQSPAYWTGVYNYLYSNYGEWTSFFFNSFKTIIGDPDWYSKEDTRDAVHADAVKWITSLGDKGVFVTPYVGIPYHSPFKCALLQLCRLEMLGLDIPVLPAVADIKTPLAFDNVITFTTSFTDPVSNLVYALNPTNGSIDLSGTPVFAVWDVLTTDTEMYLFATNMHNVANPLSTSCEGVDGGNIGQVVVLKLDSTGATIPTKMTMFSTLYDIEILANKTMQDAITEFEASIDTNNATLMASYVSLGYIASDWATDAAAAKTAVATAICEPLRRGTLPNYQNIEMDFVDVYVSAEALTHRTNAITEITTKMNLTAPADMTSFTALSGLTDLSGGNTLHLDKDGDPDYYEYVFNPSDASLTITKTVTGEVSGTATCFAEVTETSGVNSGVRTLYFEFDGIMDGHSWQQRGWFEGIDNLPGAREIILLHQYPDNTIRITKWMYALNQTASYEDIVAFYDTYTGGLVNGWTGYFNGSGSSFVGSPYLPDPFTDADVEAAANTFIGHLADGHIFASTWSVLMTSP